MSSEISTPDKIWIITEEVSEEISTTTSEKSTANGDRSGDDVKRRIGNNKNGSEVTEEIIRIEKDTIKIKRTALEVSKLKQNMSGFLQAMREMLDEADQPSSKIQLDEVELSVEINGEGQISLFGMGGGKAGGKGAMTFKFKRR
ncbi:MAG: hypothetical protein QNJ47_13090 [Nostocaceae cyanobacterium]|nr:hypothetical protein [Nostocaceae cyanobacterium]